MANIKIKGLEQYMRQLSSLQKKSEKIVNHSVYVGAGFMADAMKESIKNLPIDNHHGTSDDMVKGVTKQQKADLIEGFGIAPIRETPNDVNTKIGWSGYGKNKTKKYPKGVPNQLIALSVEGGTSFRKKIPFTRTTINKNKKAMIEIMEKDMIEQIKKEMK